MTIRRIQHCIILMSSVLLLATCASSSDDIPENPTPPDYNITSSVEYVTTSRVYVQANFGQSGQTFTESGVVIGNSSNPTINDQRFTLNQSSSGSTSIGEELTGLNANSTYHARLYFITSDNAVNYGPNMQFSTVGGVGEAGGTIIFDKFDDLQGGWRYIESSNSQLSSAWGCTGEAISAYNTGFGAGRPNTSVIIIGCLESDCAARRCVQFELNGFQDWYLPNANELVQVLETYIQEGNTALLDNYWSSNAILNNPEIATSISASSQAPFNISSTNILRATTRMVVPVRRY